MMDRLRRDEPVVYQLQIQLNDTPERPHVWNPQLVHYTRALGALSVLLSVFTHAAHRRLRRGGVVSGVRRMNEVNARRARLGPGWVTVFGRVYHLGAAN